MSRNIHVQIKNIYYMLCYVFRVLWRTDFKDIEAEEFENIHTLFTVILTKGIDSQLKHGLYREYVDYAEDIKGVRGKLDMPESIRHKTAHRQLMSCEFDELSENNIHNQILKATANLLIRSDKVKEEYKQPLSRDMRFFSEIDNIDPQNIIWANVHIHRNNQTYQMLIWICRFIIDGMLLSESSGEYKLADFVDDDNMHSLYEKFVLEYYRYHFPQLNPSSPQIEWVLEGEKKTTDRLPAMFSDIVLSYGDTVLIVDTKYYSHTTQMHYGKEIYHTHNINQIFVYVKNKESSYERSKPHSVSGMLLYAQTDDSEPLNEVYNMSGNTIEIRTLDLNVDFSEIRKQLNDIVEEFFSQCF